MTDQGPIRQGDDGAQYIVIPGTGAGPGMPGPDLSGEPGGPENSKEAVERPAKVMRIGSMIRQLLEEVRQTQLDPASRMRLKEIYENSVRELADTLSPDLAAELDRMALPFEQDEPSDAELRIAQAQLVGWLEGLFHGIQAAVFAQQMTAQAQLEEMRRRGLPPGRDPDDRTPGAGQYL
jgi:Protein of unknown function (DUF2587)